MAAPAVIDTSSLRLGDTVTSAKGAKSIPIAYADSTPCVWQPPPMSVLWQPQAYNDPEATRVNICFSPTPEVSSFVQSFDAWLCTAIAASSQRLLGTQLTVDDVKARYQSPLRTHEASGAQALRVKMNLSGRTAVKCWDTFRKPRELPESWTNCTVTPRIAIRSVWLMGRDMGCTLELQQAMLEEAPTECPF